jgi:hypothetical protein
LFQNLKIKTTGVDFMAMLKKAIKDNVMAGENKYKYDEDKIGQVLECNEPENRCTVSVITRDGISAIEYNVYVRSKKFPKVGDYVELKEQFRKFSVVGILNDDDLETSLNGDIYTNIYGGATNGYVGYN